MSHSARPKPTVFAVAITILTWFRFWQIFKKWEHMDGQTPPVKVVITTGTVVNLADQKSEVYKTFP